MMNRKIILALLIISAFYAVHGVTVTETWNLQCSPIIPNNALSPLISITWTSTYQFDGTCATWDFGPDDKAYNATFGNGTQILTRATSNPPPDGAKFIDNGFEYWVAYGILGDSCVGDSYARTHKFPLADLNRCRAGQCILTETGSTNSYFITIGPACGVNICKGSDTQKFPAGLQ